MNHRRRRKHWWMKSHRMMSWKDSDRYRADGTIEPGIEFAIWAMRPSYRKLQRGAR